MKPETMEELGATLNSFPQGKSNPELLMQTYAVDLAGFSDGAIVQACRRFRRGEVMGQNKTFAPSIAEFVAEVKKRQELLGLLADASRRLPAPSPIPGADTPTDRMRARLAKEMAARAVLFENMDFVEFGRRCAALEFPVGSQWRMGTVYGPLAEAGAQDQALVTEPAETDQATAFGPVWSAFVFGTLLAGPQGGALPDAPMRADHDRAFPSVMRAFDRASVGRGLALPERWHALKDAMEPVVVDGPLAARWRGLFSDRRWPKLPVPRMLPVIYAPKAAIEEGAEPRLTDCETALDQFAGALDTATRTDGATGDDRAA
ncbi:hypothetical protein [Oceaniradius stylonematis]|uniref:hypothetical protein n=1 Tax=Oceaniradius stylonematis TaxID=2184161 RepID=UPI003B599995